jgi:hypothetical protein
MKMKKRIKRFDEGMGVEDDSPEMQSSTIDRNAMRLINESGRKVGSGRGKSKDKDAVITKKEITVSSPEDNLSSANSDDNSYDRKELRNRPEQDNTYAVTSMPTRGIRIRTEAEKEAGAKTLKEGLPFAIPMAGAGIKMGLKAAPALEAQAFRDMMLKRGDAVKKMFEEQKAARAAQRAATKAERDAIRESRGITQGPKNMGYNKGGKIKKYAKGGMVSASSRADGIAQRGKTRGKVC